MLLLDHIRAAVFNERWFHHEINCASKTGQYRRLIIGLFSVFYPVVGRVQGRSLNIFVDVSHDKI